MSVPLLCVKMCSCLCWVREFVCIGVVGAFECCNVVLKSVPASVGCLCWVCIGGVVALELF